MKKHALMLSAAMIALAAAPALAAGPTTITTKVTSLQKTSTTGDLTIGTGGSVVLNAATPAIEIDSDNSVTINSGTTVSNDATTGAIGLQLDATAAGTGPGAGTNALNNSGVIDVTGTGTGKYGIYVKAADTSGDVFNGDITLGSGSSTSITGDSSTGIEVGSGATLNGTVTILGALTASPTSTTALTGGGVSAIRIDGGLNGDLLIGTTGVVSAYGNAAKGLVVNGPLTGSITNEGVLQAIGIANPSTASSASNPEAGSALIIANNVTGGIYNAGPQSSGSSTASAAITSGGAGPAIEISPGAGGVAATGNVVIGPYMGELSGAYDFINRGVITASPQRPNLSSIGMEVAGTTDYTTTLAEGIFNSGTLTASATTDSNATGTSTAQALVIANFASVGQLNNNSTETGRGVISASVSGASTGKAFALVIQPGGSLPKLTNTGIISASATTTDTTVGTLDSYAILDQSGTLLNIDNAGTIAATATTLDSNAQVTIAADLSLATSGITFNNSGTVTGNLLLGAHDDTLNVAGSAARAATITGNIAFNGGNDTLTIGDYATVKGELSERGGGTVDVTVGTGAGTGTLTLTNTTAGLAVSNLAVKNGGTLNVALAQAFNSTSSTYVGSIINATGTIDLAANSNFGVSFGSFISTPGGTGTAEFTLLEAPVGNMTLSNYTTIKSQIGSEIPYLFHGALCTYNVSGINSCSLPAGQSKPTDAQLVLQLTPKTTSQIGLTGNAAKIFSYANAALATDDALGAAVISGVTDKASAQAAYSGFLPDLSGSTRAVAVWLTDQATGPVGARQRALRMYAAQPGGTTMWGQEFVQRLTSAGDAEAYRASGFGFALGIDGGTPENGRYGGAITFFSGDQTNKSTNFTKTTNEWYMLTGYTDWRGKGLFFDSQLSAAFGRLTGKRSIILTDTSGNSFRRTAKGKRNGLLVAAGVSTGAVFTYGGTVLIPQISLDALTMREEGYTETGGGAGTTGADGLDLKVQPYYASSARGYIGTTLRQDIELDGWFLQPEGRIGYRYDFLSDPVKLKAAFASVGNQFTLTGPDPERGTVVAGGSLAVTTGNWSIGVNYDYLRGDKGSVSQSGTVTLVGRI